jgi:hypothetical protein
MNVEIFTLCHKYVARQNSVDVLGIFTGAWNKTVPHRLHGEVIAARLNFVPERDPEGTRKLVIALRDDREFIVETHSDELEIKYDGFPVLTHDREYVLQNISIPDFGNYSFHLYIDAKLASITYLSLERT